MRASLSRRTLTPDEERFFRFIPDADPRKCWGWHGARDEAGRGVFTVKSRVIRAHRMSWKIHKGPIPAGMRVLVTCETAECSNPRHLRLGSQSEALKAAFDKGHIRRQYGARNARTKLSDEDVALIRALRGRDWSTTAIADRFGVAAVTVSHICTGAQRTSLIAATPTGRRT
jgi:hypothetical protein